MFDPERLLGSLLSDSLRGRPGRGLKRAALSPQGLMVLGGVAIAAYEHFVTDKRGAGGPPPPPPSAMPPPPPPPAGARSEGQVLTLIAAMVAAAKADGCVDEDEKGRLLARLEEVGAGAEERAFLAAELARPLDLDGLVARVEGPVQAAEVYAASAAVIDADTAAEQGYLALLAARLGLSAELVGDIHARVAAARGAALSGEETTS
jgi:uncharacterized membrane protein YebE (DUF533 family)